MGKYQYSELEQQLNNVLQYQNKELKNISFGNSNIEDIISSSEKLLLNLGYSLNDIKPVHDDTPMKVAVLPSWESLCLEAEKSVGSHCELESIFTEQELNENREAIKILNKEFNEIHKLDKTDIGIIACAGILGAAIDILMVGIPQKTPNGLSAGTLSNYIRDLFDKKFPIEEMEKLANSKICKVPYDAQDNRHTKEYVTGLSAYYHRLLSLGHDPLLGLLFGVTDILAGRMTTIDKKGKIVSQVMENYTDRREMDIFAAIAKQILHFKSDIMTSMGLPVPLMAVFNLFQFGSIGEEEQTIAEIVQGMYYEGYDFIHFCSMSIPTMIIEVIVRLGYALKRMKEGYTLNESLPFDLNRIHKPKLSTMLFVAHSSATAINAGKIYFTKNPMSINYPQWIAFAKYSYKQLKWAIYEKEKMKNDFVLNNINQEFMDIYDDIERNFYLLNSKYIIVME